MIVNIEATGDVILPDEFDIGQLADAVAGEALKRCQAPAEMVIDCRLCTAEEIRELNRRFRDRDQVTDVLSFPNIEMAGPCAWPKDWPADTVDPETDLICLGSIALCAERALTQAEAYGHSLKRETAFLIAHSVLHLCGYDHMTEEEAAQMEEMQEEILDTLGITRDPV